MAETKPSPSQANRQEEDDMIDIRLKNPVIAGVLAWLVPGLGHYYQGRYFKAFLFAVCIIPTFLAGCYLGSSPEVGFARNVYYSWREGDRRLFFFTQCGIGAAAIPALVQANRVNQGLPPFFRGAMSPPYLPSMGNVPPNFRGVPPTLDEIIGKLGRYFEIGTIFTLVAGLLNLLVIFDAIDGPVFFRKEEEKDEKEPEPEAA